MVSLKTIIVCLYISASYVLSIYATTKTLQNYPARKDDPRVIKSRAQRITFVLLLNLIVVPFLISQLSVTPISWQPAFQQLGLVPGIYYRYPENTWDPWSYMWDISKTIGLGMLLYTGCIVDSILYYIFIKDSDLWKDICDNLSNIWGFRNYIFAPITEEIFYTSMLLNVYIALNDRDKLGLKTVLWQPPIFFGLAHVHHAYEIYLEGAQTVPAILLNTLIQLSYTTVFGSFTNYVFLSTGGNLWACILLHAFCNFMGLPGTSRLADEYHYIKNSSSQLINLWKRCYIALLFMGLVFFKDNVHMLARDQRYKINLE